MLIKSICYFKCEYSSVRVLSDLFLKKEACTDEALIIHQWKACFRKMKILSHKWH